jgi:regulator of RNase E activity RraA
MSSLVSPETLDALRKVDSATLSNAIEPLKVRDRTEGYGPWELKCQFPDLGPMVGYAVTVTAKSTEPGPRDQTKLLEVFDAIAAVDGPVVVVYQNVGVDVSRSCFVGDNMCSAFSRLGAVGVATDGGFRDPTGIREHAPGFQIFSPGLVVSHGNGVHVDVNVPVSIFGLDVEPGDLLHGDENGLVKVPVDVADAVLDEVKKVVEKERGRLDYTKRDDFTLEGLKKLYG